jgi:hypothetical protein
MYGELAGRCLALEEVINPPHPILVLKRYRITHKIGCLLECAVTIPPIISDIAAQQKASILARRFCQFKPKVSSANGEAFDVHRNQIIRAESLSGRDAP